MTVRPLLEGARDWVPPENVAELYGAGHAAIRARQRGISSIPGGLLMWVVLEAVRRGRTDLVAPVYQICEGSTLHRILLPEGPFYPVFREGALVTIYGPREKRQMRHTRRLRKRKTGSRVRKAPPGEYGNEW